MENTGKVFFEDDTPQWYIALGSRWVGPLSATDVYQKVLSQEITLAHYVWKPGQPDWKRISDEPTFQVAVPAIPSKDLINQVKDASKPGIRAAGGRGSAPPPKPSDAEERSWFLFYNDSQFGPFSTDEISRFLRVGKIHGRVHIWKDGMGDWVRLETIDRFADDVAEAKNVRDARKAAAAPKPGAKAPAPAQIRGSSEAADETRVQSGKGQPAEQRKAPRRPLVAKILLANQETLVVGVCRDISVGGMQVLTDRIPGEPGSRIKMNVSPASQKSGGDKSNEPAISPFVAEGVIVRILEDGRGFSFRFEKLPESSRKVIEDYIRT